MTRPQPVAIDIIRDQRGYWWKRRTEYRWHGPFLTHQQAYDDSIRGVWNDWKQNRVPEEGFWYND